MTIAFDPATGSIVYDPTSGDPAKDCPVAPSCSCPTVYVTVTGGDCSFAGLTVRNGETVALCPDTYTYPSATSTFNGTGANRETWIGTRLTFVVGGGGGPFLGFKVSGTPKFYNLTALGSTTSAFLGGSNASLQWSPYFKYTGPSTYYWSVFGFVIGLPYGTFPSAYIRTTFPTRPNYITNNVISRTFTVGTYTIDFSRGGAGSSYNWGDVGTFICSGSNEIV